MHAIASYFRTPVRTPVLILAGASLALYLTACLVLMPPFDTFGDAPGYLEAMRVLNGAELPATFTPNRILTTFLSVSTVSALAFFTGDYLASWFFLNTLYFFGLAFASYFLFRRITGSEAGSIIGALFVVGNYDVLTFGLNYLMDSTGWFWFMVSLYATYRHIETKRGEYLWYAALAAGVGTLFKEYAFFGFAPLGLYLIYAHWRQPVMFARSLVPLVVSLLPVLLIHVAVFFAYGYSYLDWYGMNTETFGFSGWAWNASRSYTIALSFLIPLAAMGGFAFVREMRADFKPERVLFVASLIVPALAVLAWPIITERLVFLAVPLFALLAAYAVKHHERHWPWFGFVWLLYVLLALKTDGLLLSYLYTL
ncbi:MAG TPA: glycosyltransferase family 39 protein [Candidatus Paceibacterota bacterium]|jgi:hypothetical protein